MWSIEPAFDGSTPSTLEETKALLLTLARLTGFDHVSYVGGRAFNPKHGSQAMWSRPPVIVNSFPTEFLDIYHRRDLAQVDPVTRQALATHLPLLWDIETYPREDPAQKEFLSLARDFRVSRGLTLPVYGPAGEFALFSFVSTAEHGQFRDLIRESATRLHAASHCFHQMINQFRGDVAREFDLRPREIEVLKWTTMGKTSAEMAEIIGISDKTVQFHLYRAMKKLDVYSKASAAAKAVMLGLIEI